MHVFPCVPAVSSAPSPVHITVHGCGGYGRYTWKYVHSKNPPEKVLSAVFEASPEGWSPLLDGVFGGSAERASAAFAEVISSAETVRQNQW